MEGTPEVVVHLKRNKIRSFVDHWTNFFSCTFLVHFIDTQKYHNKFDSSSVKLNCFFSFFNDVNDLTI